MRTTTVLLSMHEMQREKVMPNAVCRSMQVQGVGSPIKGRAHRKHRPRETRMRKLSSELLALTMGVFLLQAKIRTTVRVQQKPTRATTARVMPMVSL